MGEYWPDPDKIRSVLQEYDLDSSQLLHSPYNVPSREPLPIDTTVVHLTSDGTVVAIKDPEILEKYYRNVSPVNEQLPCSLEPALRIPLEDLPCEPDPDALPEDRRIDTAPFYDGGFLKVDVPSTSQPDDLVWMTREEYQNRS